MRFGCKAPLGDSRVTHTLIYTALLLATSAFAQNAPASTSTQEPTATIRSSTRLVLVPTIVKDRSGKTVSGLKKEDFNLQENGKDKEIAVFEEVKPVKMVTMTRATGPGGMMTNMVKADAPTRLRILALDTISSDVINQKRARDAMLKFLADSFDPSSPTALILFKREGIKMVHDFTSDPQSLAAALKLVKLRLNEKDNGEAQVHATIAGSGAKLGEAEQPATPDEQAVNELLQFSRDPDVMFRHMEVERAISATMENFRHLAKVYGGVPGRKELIWITAGVPFSFPDPQDISNQQFANAWEQTFDALAGANMAVYPIDLSGLLVRIFPDISECRTCMSHYQQLQGTALSSATPGGSGRSRGAGGSGNVGGGPESEPSLNLRSNEFASLESIANATGGRAIYNTNDIDKAMALATDDAASYYMLGFYARPAEKKIEWRKLKVKTAYDGAKVRSRAGYFASTPEEDQTARTNDLRLALGSTMEFTDIPVMARFTQTTEKGANRAVGFQMFVHASAPSIAAIQDGKVDFDFMAIASTPDGKPAARFLQPYHVTLTPEKMEQVQKHGLGWGNAFELPPGEYRVRFLVRDNQSGRMGSVLAPLSVH